MTTVQSFPPIAAPDATLLILGSMPGRMSLQRQQYYAHPRNAFWTVAGSLFGFAPSLDYEARKKALTDRRVALWDVLRTCTRHSSLDSDIVEASVVANDFVTFFSRHQQLRLICFNGAKAEQSYRRYVLPRLDMTAREIPTVRLPSTSPAHASMSTAQKLNVWREAMTSMGVELAMTSTEE